MDVFPADSKRLVYHKPGNSCLVAQVARFLGAWVESLLKTLQSFGLGRMAAIAGGAAGVAAILVAIMMRMGGSAYEPALLQP